MLPVLLTAAHVAVIDERLDRVSFVLLGAKFAFQFLAVIHNCSLFFVIAIDWQNHHMLWRQSRWQHQTIIIAVRHDQRTDQSSRDAPRCRPGVHLLAIGILELDVLNA
jgi:hypothetical protein